MTVKAEHLWFNGDEPSSSLFGPGSPGGVPAGPGVRSRRSARHRGTARPAPRSRGFRRAPAAELRSRHAVECAAAGCIPGRCRQAGTCGSGRRSSIPAAMPVASGRRSRRDMQGRSVNLGPGSGQMPGGRGFARVDVKSAPGVPVQRRRTYTFRSRLGRVTDRPQLFWCQLCNPIVRRPVGSP